MASPVSRDCVNEASFEPDVDPWICAGANLPTAGGMVMKGRQPWARKGGKQVDLLMVCILRR